MRKQPIKKKIKLGMTGSRNRISEKALETLRKFLDTYEIVDESDTIIAFPASAEEVIRSGTWATIRYARKTKTPLHIILPDGNFLTKKKNPNKITYFFAKN